MSLLISLFSGLYYKNNKTYLARIRQIYDLNKQIKLPERGEKSMLMNAQLLSYSNYISLSFPLCIFVMVSRASMLFVRIHPCSSVFKSHILTRSENVMQKMSEASPVDYRLRLDDTSFSLHFLHFCFPAAV